MATVRALGNTDAPMGMILGYAVLGLLGGTVVAGVLPRMAGHAPAATLHPLVPTSVTAAAGALIGARVAPFHPVLAAVLLGIGVCAAWISILDLAVQRIPDAAVIVVLVLVADRLLLDAWDSGRWLPAGASVLAALGVLVVGGVIAVLTPHLGLGDVKLAAALTPLPVYLGAAGSATVFVAALTGLTAAVAITRGGHPRDEVPLGPAIVYGVLLAVCYAVQP